MYKGKRLKQRTSGKRLGVLLVSLALLATVSVGGTLAYLVAEDEPVVNTFTLSSIPNEIVEDFDGEVKSNVKIKNTSTTAPAYIRAMVVASWVEVDADGQTTGNVYGVAPVEGTDYSMEWRKDGWAEGADGYYYYTSAVGAGEETGILFTDCQLSDEANQPIGHKLVIEIIAQSIQADGVDADGKTPVELAWGIEAARLVGAVDAESSEGGEG